jgi:CRISPR/Cas system endoribonuclease Cas6 (RAMP superfamily)
MDSAPPPRRIKSYSSATGYVYQYHFHEAQPVRRGLTFGTQYTYLVSADRKTSFPVRILVVRSAMERWARVNGRGLSGTEEYAAAKMRLFQAFDQTASLSANQTELVVDESNLTDLLAQLDID